MNTTHKDSFCFDGLPDQSLWPEFIFDFAELQYAEKLNAAVELLDKTVSADYGSRPAIIDGKIVWTYTQLLHQANRFANLLVGDLGLQTGNRVLLRGGIQPCSLLAGMGLLKPDLVDWNLCDGCKYRNQALGYAPYPMPHIAWRNAPRHGAK